MFEWFPGLRNSCRCVDRAPFGGQLGASTPNCLAYEAGAEALPLWEEIWPGPAMKLVGPLAARSPGLRLILDHEIERHFSADEILQGRLALTLSPSWMSMARLAFPSRLELNRPEASFNAAPLANVILTTFLYVSPVQTMPPWEKTGVPGDVGLTHFHSSTISGSSSCIISRPFASVFPRQSSSSLILASITAEADSTGTFSMYSSHSRT